METALLILKRYKAGGEELGQRIANNKLRIWYETRNYYLGNEDFRDKSGSFLVKKGNFIDLLKEIVFEKRTLIVGDAEGELDDVLNQIRQICPRGFVFIIVLT